MADLTPKKINLAEINGGKQYEINDGIQPNAINDPIQASAYAQALATNQPNIDNVDNFGTPIVSIEEVDGFPRFKFENLNAVEISKVEQTVSSEESGAENVLSVYLNNGDVKNFSVYNGKTGAKLVSRVLQGQNQEGGNIYLDTFDDDTTAYFIAPKGEKGDKGDKGDTYVLTEADKDEIGQIAAPYTEPYVDKIVENEIHEQMVEATKGFTVIENVSNLVENNISFTKNYVSYNKLNDYVTLRLVGTANSLNATTSVNVATMSDIFAPNEETQKEVSVGGINTIVSVGTDGSITFNSNNMLNGDFDVEITWELTSDSIIGHLELQAVETVNVNSVVRKGDITTINLDAYFINHRIAVQSSYEYSGTLFYISDAFGVQARKFSCECDFLLTGYKPAQGMLDFEIRGGDCRTYKNAFNEVAYITGVHNLQLKFDTTILPAELTFSLGEYARSIVDEGSIIHKNYIELNIKINFAYLQSTKGEWVTYEIGAITQIYAPKTSVQVPFAHGNGYITISNTGLISLYTKLDNNYSGMSQIINTTYYYQ